MESVETLLKTTLGEIERLLNSRTVVGEPITVNGSTVIPLVSVGFGFGAGGGSGPDPKAANHEAGGAGSGGGGGVKPVAVIVANTDGVRVEAINKGAAPFVQAVGDVVGKIVEKRAQQKPN